MTLLKAINLLENLCLSNDCKPTTAAELVENGRAESEKYYIWLRAQAPMTATMMPLFQDLEKLPTK